ncbi:MAG: peptidoglycan -binding protein [Hyphomicrobiales bacterium]|nr:peptidoglycan -binding protein [Hyphomicrobiales bacterium]
MSWARTRRRSVGADYWPGFVDAMATLLLVVTFLLSLFMVVQFFVTQEASNKDSALERLNRQIAQLTELLALEVSAKKSLQDNVVSLSATLDTSKAENTRLQGLLGLEGGKTSDAEGRAATLSSALDEQTKLGAEALARVELLNQQIAALRRQVAALESALETSEQQDKESQARIADLGNRLNVALARKVQELARYRSDFFGRLRTILGDREEIRIEGDRFVFQAEVLFPTGSDDMNPEGLVQITKLAKALKDVAREIPPEINWVLRVDGHTDARPIATPEFPSNWELSAARAISVVQTLIAEGVPPKRLVAAGFGEFQPLDTGAGEEAFTRNRRIELKLTEK